jgi:putative peptide zinc metalloprotease protein
MSFVASIDRSLRLRLRPDLVATPVAFSGSATYVIKDPATLEHFQFTSQEFRLLQRLRQPASIAELQSFFAEQFRPQTITADALWDFVRRLHEAGLLISEAPGQGDELLARRRDNRTRHWALAWTRILALRWRGIDPNALLSALHNRCRWLFSPVALLAAVVLMLYAGGLLIGHFDEFRRRLPELSALTDARNVALMLAILGGIKVLHELGHALACKHFDGEVREMGFMLLAFSPCLYCDVSDAWRFANKWHRICVSAAGMMVELVLAAVATDVWWYAQPGFVQLAALDVMLLASVGTFVVNGNPLLRFDGYYILSDLVEIPNLWQRSREAVKMAASRLLLGLPMPDDPLTPKRRRVLLLVYGIASKAYVAFVCLAIVWGLVLVLHPLRLQNLAYAVGLVMAATAIIGPAKDISRTLRHPARRAELPVRRMSGVAAMGFVILMAVLAWPVNYYVRAPLVLMPANATRVFATIDGTLATALPAGTRVSAGEPVATLHNRSVDLEIVRLRGELRLQALRVEHLERLRAVDPKASEQLPAAHASLAGLEHRLAERQADAKRLMVAAPREGVIIAPPRISASHIDSDRLPTWSGTILDEANAGAHVEPGTLVCLVGDARQLSAALLVDDAEAPRLSPGQHVRLLLDEVPTEVIEGTVVDVARYDTSHEQMQTGTGHSDLDVLFTGLLPRGESRPHYRASVRFDSSQWPLTIGGRGTAKIATERITLARRILRFVAQTFRLPT